MPSRGDSPYTPAFPSRRTDIASWPPLGPHIRHGFEIRHRRQRDSDISKLWSVDAFVIVARPRERRSHHREDASSRRGAQHKSPCTASDGNIEMMRIHRVCVEDDPDISFEPVQQQSAADRAADDRPPAGA